jgi:hypothetical protein
MLKEASLIARKSKRIVNFVLPPLLLFEGRLLLWQLFWTLVRRRDQWTSREMLRSCWQAAGRSEPESNEDNVEDNVIDRAICDLRDRLTDLDLQLENRPRIGWRLA